MNNVTVEPISRSVTVEPISRAVTVEFFARYVSAEVIRIHTDYTFLSLYQTSATHTEV